MILRILLVVFLILELVSAWRIVHILLEYRTAEESVRQMQQFIELEAPAATTPVETLPPVTESDGETVAEAEPEASTEAVAEPSPYPVVDFAALHEMNPDVVAWIYIEDTAISYPIVQGTDNKKYVNQMVDGRYNAAGSIFMDYRNDSDFSDRNTVIYGHNMKNGSMFAQVPDYRQKGFLEEHPTGVIVTPDQDFQFEIIAGYVTDIYGDAWKTGFAGDREYLTWLEAAMKRSIIGGSYDVTASDRVITLSTCVYDFEEARFVLVCRIIE